MDQQLSGLQPEKQFNNPNNTNQKTLSIILGVVIVVLIGVIIYMVLANKSNQVAQQPSPTPTQLAQWSSATPTPTTSDETANWKTYTDSKYGFEFKYPSDWSLVAGDALIWKGNGINNQDNDNIQTLKVSYGNNADGSEGPASNRTNYIKFLTTSGFSNISITGGQGYYDINETKGGPTPEIYLVGDKEIFLMVYHIYDTSKTLVSEAERLLKQIAGTFKFTE